MFKTAPAVFAVDREYQIMVESKVECLVSVLVAGRTYFDETNGILNSLSPVHRVCVPMAELDAAGGYTLCARPIRERKPYFTECEEMREYPFVFRPVPRQGDVRLYTIADAHNRLEGPIKAAEAFGKIDLLILNGDVIEHSGDPSKFSNIYQLCAALTSGEIPVVFARGNHDMRGRFAEKFADYTPGWDRKTYYTFHLGSIWGIVLDCGEDKDDRRPEYGHTIACHAFRERQTHFLRSVIRRAGEEYAAFGVQTRLLICHNPFTRRFSEPFDIEKDLYREWAALLGAHVHPDLMICGHTHEISVDPVGGERDAYGQSCPVVVTSAPLEDRYIGCGFVLKDEEIEVCFTDSKGAIVQRDRILKNDHRQEKKA